MNEFITVEVLGTFAGITAATCVLTEVIKRYISIDPKWIALAVAGLLCFGRALIFTGDFSAGGIFMTTVNWLVVTGSSIGLFEGAVKKFENKFSNPK